mmetsp:Transcript_5106/g.9715  ORF Transcript_5106/g.9715 Transcript_5106/m.9715 type:complete len:145 (-) Transcript_5106:378-812(-)
MTTRGFSRREAHFYDEVRYGGGAAETMDEVGIAASLAQGASLPPLAKDASPPRGAGARGMKSTRAARPGPDEVRNNLPHNTPKTPRRVTPLAESSLALPSYASSLPPSYGTAAAAAAATTTETQKTKRCGGGVRTVFCARRGRG